MNPLLAMRILLFAGEFFLASALTMGVAWLAAVAFPRRASLRHLIWLTALGALLLLPVASFVIPSRVLLEHFSAPPPIPPSQATLSMAIPNAMPNVMRLPAATPPVRPIYFFALPSWHDPLLAELILALWLTGLLVSGLYGAMAVYGLHALLGRSVPHDFPALSLPELKGMRCRLRLSVGNSPGPMTWGIFKPVILLPEKAADWPQDRLKAVLRHELAHVRRHDSAVQLLSLLVCALYWPNPVVWLGARALRREAEMAADDAVLASGITPSVYAHELVRLAAEFRAQRAAVSGIAMAGRSALEERVKSVLAPTLLRTGVTVMDALKIACLALLATSTLTVLRPDIAVAQSGAAASVKPASRPPVAPVPPISAVETPAPQPAEPVAPPAPPSVHDDTNSANAELIRQQAALVKKQAQMEAGQAEIAKQQVEIAKQQADMAGRQAQIAADQAKRDVAAQMIRIRAAQEDVSKAIAEARIGESVARAMAEAQAVADAMKQAGPEIEKAMADVPPQNRSAVINAKIGEVVANALKQAQPQIDAAVAKARADAQAQPGMPAQP